MCMQVKEIKQDGLSHELEVTVPANDIDKTVVERLKEVGKTAKQPGFRPGKMPLDMLRKKYGRAVMGEVLESVVNDSTKQVIEDKKLRPAMQPKIEVKEFDEGKDLIFSMKLDVLPDFKVADLKGIKIEKPIAKIEDKEINEALERITSQHKGSAPISGKRGIKKGDIAVFDFAGRTADDDVAHDGMQAEGHKLEIGSGQFIPGFEDQMIGKKAGEEFDVKVTFPKEYQAKDLAGRDAIFAINLHEIHEESEAKVDDEFAKQLGFDDEAALRDAVKHQLTSDYANQTRLKMKRQLLDALDDAHQFDIPQGMVDAELEGITKQLEQERAQNPDAEELSDEDKEELKTISVRRVRLGLVLAEIGQTENVTVSDQELQGAVITEAQKFPGQEKMVFDFYQKNPQMLENLRAPLFEDKVVDILFDRAKVTDKEVSVEELMKEDEDDKPAKKKAAKKKPAAKKKAAKKTAKKEDDCCASGSCDSEKK